MKLDEVLGLPKSGVVILKKQGTVLVTYSISMGAYLETLYQQFQGRTGMELEIRSAGADLETLKLHTEYYRDLYGRQGILLQKHIRKALQYKVRVVPSKDFKAADVEIVTARGDSMLVGRFKNMDEARLFIETCYDKKGITYPVYALNSATKELLRGQKKMLDIK